MYVRPTFQVSLSGVYGLGSGATLGIVFANLGCVGGNSVEDVDKEEEEDDKEAHSAADLLRRDQE